MLGTAQQIHSGITLAAWHNEDTLDERFPAIHSHCTRKNVSVEQVCASGTLDSNLFVPCLSNQDTSEFSQLQQIVIQTTLSDTRDKHSAKGNLTPAAFIVFCSPGMRHHTLLPSSSGIVMLLQEFNSLFGCSCMAEFSVEQLCSGKILSTRLFVKYAI